MVEIETSGACPLRLETKRWHRVWITVSPKPKIGYKIDPTVLYRTRALKYVVTEEFDPSVILRKPVTENIAVFLQPCDYMDPERNKQMVAKTLELLQIDPQWRLSLQVHKIIGVL